MLGQLHVHKSSYPLYIGVQVQEWGGGGGGGGGGGADSAMSWFIAMVIIATQIVFKHIK